MPWKSGGGWNYRVLRYEDGDMGIHEVFYTDGAPTSCTKDPVGVVSDGLEGLRDTLQMMTRALAAEVIDYEDIKGRAVPSESNEPKEK